MTKSFWEKHSQPIRNLIIGVFFASALAGVQAAANESEQEDNVSVLPAQTEPSQPVSLTKDILKGGWYAWDPYQYIESGAGFNRVTGMDVQLTNHYASALGLGVNLEEVSWRQHLADVESGARDIVAGAAEVEERKKWGYYSIPYRVEENVAYVLRSKTTALPFTTPQELINLLQTKAARVGVIDGYHYASEEFMAFVNDPANADRIIKSKTDFDNFQLLLHGKVDVYLADRVVGATIAWRTKNLNVVEERRLNMSYPLHFIFSKKTIPESVVEKFNDTIIQTKKNGDYGKIISQYLFPVLLLQTLDSNWFFILEVVGILAFAISGLIIAYEERANLFGTLVMTALPSVGGGIMRDVIAQRTPLGIVKSPSYLFIVVAVVVVAFLVLNIYRRIFASRVSGAGSKEKLHRMSNTVIQISDAIGLGAFTVVGVTVAVIVKADPLWFWGPLLAAITGVGGGFARDLLRSQEKRSCLTGEFYAEIALIWGLIFALIMQAQIEEVNTERLIYAVVFAAAGAAITRIIAFFYKIPGIPFSFLLNKPKSGSGLEN